MAGSDEELAIRGATTARIRELLPTARVIHELNVEGGTVRADIAAVTEDRLYLFEIKSSRDTLGRLPTQIKHFHPVCHGLVVVADEKWCGRATDLGYPNCDARKIITYNAPRTSLWQWPEPERRYGRDWNLPYRDIHPWPRKMLDLLWADELRDVATRHRISVTPRTPAYKLTPILCDALTGGEITKAVCQALRRRSFAWADDPIGVPTREPESLLL